MTPSRFLGNRFRAYCTAFARRAACAALACCWAASAWAGPNVLLLWDDDDDSVTNHPPLPGELNENSQALIAALEAAGIAVTLSDRNQSLWDGHSPAPNEFDAVIHLNGNITSAIDHLPTSSVFTLVNYVQNLGGGIITEDNTASQINIAAAQYRLSPLMADLMVLDIQSGAPPAFGTVTCTPVAGQENHPLLTGLTPPFSFTAQRMRGIVRTFATQPATVVLRDEAGLDAAAVRDFGLGRVVSFNHKGNFRAQGAYAPTLSDPSVQRLFINGVLWCDKHAPSAVSIEKEVPGAANAAGAKFLVNFSEGVKGVNAADFEIVASGGLGYNPTPVVTALTDRQYRVTVSGLSGTGTLGLNLLVDGSITDVSVSENPLAAGINGPIYSVDAVAPELTLVQEDPVIVPLGDKAQFTLFFNEAMDSAYSPKVDITTQTNAVIHASPAVAPPDNRVKNGLLALYTFDEGAGDTVHDRSNSGTALDLAIAAPANVHWVEGGLSIDTSTILLTTGPASKIIAGCQASNEMTLEAWIQPANTTQTGPARIATLSAGLNARDVTLEQSAADLDVRLRTTTNTTNGTPEQTAAGSAKTSLEHVVFTRNAAGVTTIYVDNAAAVTGTVDGDFSTWATNYKFALGNELSQNRGWNGAFYLVAVYGRALTAAEVDQNFNAGPVTAFAGDGAWLNSTTYRVSMDRAVVPSDSGGAVVSITGARDSAGNPMAPDTNNIGIISSTLLIVDQPAAHYTSEVGATFEFSISVTGAIGGLQYQWYKRTGNGPFQPVGPNAPTYVIPALDLSDAGDYYCSVSDAQASAQSSVSTLQVLAQLPLGGLALLSACAALAAVGAYSQRRSAFRQN